MPLHIFRQDKISTKTIILSLGELRGFLQHKFSAFEKDVPTEKSS